MICCAVTITVSAMAVARYQNWPAARFRDAKQSRSGSSDLALLLANLEGLSLHAVPRAPGRHELASALRLDLQWELRQRAQHDTRLLVVHDIDDAVLLTLHLQLKALQCGTETY